MRSRGSCGDRHRHRPLEAPLIPAISLFDAVLSVTLMVVAIRVLTASDLFQAIVVFIVFGLLMSLAWTRLHAVDVALAEAAIGAGLTGALFLNALGPSASRDAHGAKRWSFPLLLPILVLAASLALIVGDSAPGAMGDAVGLRDAVGAELGRSGATNPVTSVLLNFRAYDTLLEIAVLILAVAGVWALEPVPAPVRARTRPDPILLIFVRVLIPFIGVIAGYLLWIGTSAPGGAFQAAAVLCASGILLVVTGIARGPSPRRWAERGLVVLGFSAFLAVSLGVMLLERPFLEYPPGSAAGLILAIESLLTISIATILVALFAGNERAGPGSGG
jgi:multisubunit Na+/H+ antiporter MnhB subunit